MRRPFVVTLVGCVALSACSGGSGSDAASSVAQPATSSSSSASSSTTSSETQSATVAPTTTSATTPASAANTIDAYEFGKIMGSAMGSAKYGVMSAHYTESGRSVGSVCQFTIPSDGYPRTHCTVDGMGSPIELAASGDNLYLKGLPGFDTKGKTWLEITKATQNPGSILIYTTFGILASPYLLLKSLGNNSSPATLVRNDSSGRAYTFTGGKSSTYTTTFDSRGRPVSITDGAGFEVTFSDLGKPVSVTVPTAADATLLD